MNKTSCVLITLIIITCSLYGDSNSARPDAVTSASKTIIPINQRNQTNSKVLIILATSSQGNTQIISNALQQTLNADVVSPENVSIEMLTSYQLIGFGSGIFDEKHHSTLLSFARNLNQSNQMKVFIFSTSGIAREKLGHNSDPHNALRDILIAKGCIVIGEFNCVGLNKNSFLRFFGGMNKNRPNKEDIKTASAFAESLLNLIN